MSNSSSGPTCPSPFLDMRDFPATGGFVKGRYCAPVDATAEQLVCCMPCPTTDFIYPSDFLSWYRIAESLNALGFAFCAFILISYAVLPREKTRRHYLSVCLVASIAILALGFVIPLAVKPEQCYNDITPNDMYSSLTCAWSGALIVCGGLGCAVWIFVRALSMHLQICWDILPGKRFFYIAQALGWGIVALFLTLALTLTGVSFRFGDACHVNSRNSLGTFWGPLLFMSGMSALLQLATFLYCIHVYVRNLWRDDRRNNTSSNSSDLPSYSNSINTYSAAAVYRRVRKVMWLQWRSMLIVFFILTDVIFFSVIFVKLNKITDDISANVSQGLGRIGAWIGCLALHGKADECLKLGQKALMNQSTAMAILILLALAGTQCFLLMGRITMFTGWYDFFGRRFFNRHGEFVSLDAKQRKRSNASAENQREAQRSYELFRVDSTEPIITKPGMTAVRSPESAAFHVKGKEDYDDYFGAVDYSPTNEHPLLLTRQESLTRDFAPTSSPPPAAFSPITRTPMGTSFENKRRPSAPRVYRNPENSFSGPRPLKRSPG